ncbi:MAG: hypothetical protein WDO14_14155 [Bacteroidota bacterium]
MEKNKIESSLKWYHWLIFAGVLLLWGGGWLYVGNKYKALTDAGPFGDQFGFVNSLFSGLAFAGIIITIILQSQELKEQRKELALTRDEYRKQTINLKRQRFETTFFNMIDMQQRSLASINFNEGVGVQGISQFMSLVYQKFTNMKGLISYEEQHDAYIRALIGHTFEGFVSSYVNSLNNTYVFVKGAKLNKDATERYLLILKNYLSPIEIEFLFVHAMFSYRDDLTVLNTLELVEFLNDVQLTTSVHTYIRQKRGLTLMYPPNLK